MNHAPNAAGSPPNANHTRDYRLDMPLVTPTPDNVGDTRATALDTGLNSAAGTYAGPDAMIGDGLYLGKDVDMYKFTALAGQSVSTLVLPASTGGPSDLLYIG